jgi:hypothetical protein
MLVIQFKKEAGQILRCKPLRGKNETIGRSLASSDIWFDFPETILISKIRKQMENTKFI